MELPYSSNADSWPPALVSFQDGNGIARLLVASWVGVACTLPAIATIAFPCCLQPQSAPVAGASFVIHLLDEGWAEANLQRPALKNLGSACLFPETWTLGWGEATGAPLLAGCPLLVECRNGQPRSRFGQCLIEGEVVTASVDGEVYGLEGPLDLCRLQPLVGRRPLREGYLQPPD